MREKILTRIIKITAFVQILGGISCFAGGVRLHYIGNKLITDYMLTNFQLSRLTIYVWISCVISFLLAYGLYNLKEWSRKLLLALISFGLLNALIHLSPELSSIVTPYLPNHRAVELLKTTLLLSVDIILVVFFTRPKIKKLFRPAIIK